MRYPKVFPAAFIPTLLLTAFAALSVSADPAPVQGPMAPEPPPTFELDKAGKRAHIDFSLMPKPISEMNMKFSRFANRNLMIFFFSAKCPHCQHAFPYVQRLADSLKSIKFSAISIAIQGNTEDDIREFIRDYKVKIPVFHDEDKSFGNNYGTGYIPVIYVVNAKGEYIRYKNFDAGLTPDQIKTEAVALAKK